jgi:regulator of protease activity HflC (stomatin/prohibitin superfamily)
MSPIILVILVVLLFFWLLFSLVRVVKEYDRLVILSLGKYAGTRGPGIVMVIPFLEQAIKVDLRERFLEIPRQSVISRDNTPIDIDFLMYFRIVDPDKSVLEVDNVVRASLNIAATTLRAVIGDIELDEVLAKREQINDILRIKLDEVTHRWGLKVTSIEIREIEPPREIQDAMNRQMSAERDRRATVTRANGEREASITIAEGQKQASILSAEGSRQAEILAAEGARQAQLLRAQGYAAGLGALDEQARTVNVNTMSLQYLEMLRGVGSSPSTKFVVPLELTSLVQQFAGTMGNGGGQNSSSNGSGSGD